VSFHQIANCTERRDAGTRRKIHRCKERTSLPSLKWIENESLNQGPGGEKPSREKNRGKEISKGGRKAHG